MNYSTPAPASNFAQSRPCDWESLATGVEFILAIFSSQLEQDKNNTTNFKGAGHPQEAGQEKTNKAGGTGN